jgi:hypothetical protein
MSRASSNNEYRLGTLERAPAHPVKGVTQTSDVLCGVQTSMSGFFPHGLELAASGARLLFRTRRRVTDWPLLQMSGNFLWGTPDDQAISLPE